MVEGEGWCSVGVEGAVWMDGGGGVGVEGEGYVVWG